MVKIDKIYTKGGDSGYTSIVGGKRVKKSSNIIIAISNVDELNATLGLIINYSKSSQKKIIQNIQNDLFDMGADLATPFSKKRNTIRLSNSQTAYLEKAIDVNFAIKKLKAIEEITECHYTTGDWSILIKIYCKDNQHLMKLLNEKIQAIKGVSRTETFISLNQQISRQIRV